MNNITKVSDITATDVAEYVRLYETTESELNLINTILNTAKNYIMNYTGQTDLDAFEDFVMVVFVLCQDMWDNRSLYVDKTNLNKVIESILGMHSVNLLPRDDADD